MIEYMYGLIRKISYDTWSIGTSMKNFITVWLENSQILWAKAVGEQESTYQGLDIIKIQDKVLYEIKTWPYILLKVLLLLLLLSNRYEKNHGF